MGENNPSFFFYLKINSLMVCSSKVILAGTVPQVVEDCYWHKSSKKACLSKLEQFVQLAKERQTLHSVSCGFPQKNPKWRAKSTLGDRELSLKWSWKKSWGSGLNLSYLSYGIICHTLLMLQDSCQPVLLQHQEKQRWWGNSNKKWF